MLLLGFIDHMKSVASICLTRGAFGENRQKSAYLKNDFIAVFHRVPGKWAKFYGILVFKT